MKKVKIMLSSLALLTVVGAALAFKAKFDTDFCVTDISLSGHSDCKIAGLKCPVTQALSTFDATGTAIYCTTFEPAAGCNSNTPCLTVQGPNNDPIPSVSLKNDQ